MERNRVGEGGSGEWEKGEEGVTGLLVGGTMPFEEHTPFPFCHKAKATLW